MRSILSMIFLVATIFGCSTGQKKQPILFDISSLPCDMAKQQDIATLCGFSVVDIIFQTVTNTSQQKVCTYYKNAMPKPLPLINLTVEPNRDSSVTSDALFEGLLKNGIPGMDGISKFTKFPDERFKAVKSDSNKLYNQIYVEVEKQGLLIIEYDKSLIKDMGTKDFETKLIELYLYGGPQL